MTLRKPKKVLSLIIALTMLLTLLPATLGFAATEDIEAFVTRLYVEALDRQPEAEGLAYWVNELETGNKTAAQVVGFILVDAPEFAARNLSDDEFMDVVYKAFLNREPDDAGKAFWMSKLDEGYSRRWIMSNMMTAPTQEFQDFCTANNIKVGRIGFTGADLPPAVPDELEVEAVTAINLKQVIVEFNMNVEDNDAVVDAENYSFEDAEVNDVEVEGSTAIINLKEKVEQQTEEVLTIFDEILDEEEEFEIEFFDTIIPRAVSAEVVGADTVKVTFSEPMVKPDTRSDRRAGFSLEDADGKKKYIDDVEFVESSNNTEINVVFYTDFTDGTYYLTVENEYLDYAGYKVEEKTFELDVVIDENPPEVIGYKDAKPYEVTLIFDKDVKVIGDQDDFYHTNSSNKVVEEPTASGNEVKLTFDEDTKLPGGIAYVYIKAEAVEDLWGNKNDQQIKVMVEVEADEEAPVVESVEATSQSELEVTFSEELDKGTATDEENYKLLDEDGEEVEDIVEEAKFENESAEKDDVVILTLGEDISGNYTLVVEDVEDIYGNAIEGTEFEFFADDVTPPEFDDFDATLYNDGDIQILVIDFGEKMATDGSYSVLDLEKYKVKVNTNLDATDEEEYNIVTKDLDDIDSVSIAAIDSDEKVEIRIDTEDAECEFVEGDRYIELARVADAAGNKTEDLSGYIDIIEAESVGLESAEATATDTIVVELDDILVEFDDEDFELYAGDQPIERDYYTVDEDSSGSNTVLTFKLDEDVELDYDATVKDSTDKIYIKTSGTVTSANEYGQKVAINNEPVKDAIAPELKEKTTSSNVITLTFEENVESSVSEQLTATDITVKEDGDELQPGIDYLVYTDGSAEVKIVLIGEYADFEGELEISAEDAKYIKDESGNTIADIDEFEATIEFDEATLVDANRISQFNTTVEGVNLIPQTGKAVFEIDEAAVNWLVDQDPNVDLGADPDLIYVDILVKAPTGATKVLVGDKILPLDNEINGTTTEGRLHYFPVAQKDDQGNPVAFSESKTWNITYYWYNDTNELVAIETLEVVREAYIAPEE